MPYLVAAVLVALAILIAKFRGLLFKTKDATLVKEDQALKTEQDVLQDIVQSLKNPIEPQKDLLPHEVEEFWNGKKNE